jgi:hypothetical protein
MKAAALVLSISFAAIQPVLLTDCPCGFLCEHKNAFESGKNSVPDDCCARTAAGDGVQDPSHGEDRCFHVEPQTELDGPVLFQLPAFFVCLEFVLPALELAQPETIAQPQASGLSPPARGRPLYLQHSSLLI